jgi:predicted DNA-binding transcriptional regulator AlpA
MAHQDKRWLPGPRVRARYGVTEMTLWRWIHDEELAFPQPVYVNKRKYWVEDELDAFDRRQLLKSISQRHQRATEVP